MSVPGKKVIVGVNENGYRIGEHHHNSRISNEKVDEIRALHEDDGLGYRKISKLTGIKRSTIQKICNYEIRAQTPDRYKKIEVKPKD